MSGARSRRPVLEVGARIRYAGRRWQVVAIAGQRIHLTAPDDQDGGDRQDEPEDRDGHSAADPQGEDGGPGREDRVVLAGYLFADPGFAVLGAPAPDPVPKWGLLEGVPEQALERALEWQRHVREVETGLPGPPGSSGTPRPQYEPGRWTLAQREQAKAEELTESGFGRVSRTTVQRMRLDYRAQGLWGLVDHRSTRPARPTGRTDERVVAAVLEALERQRVRSKGTVNGLRPLVRQILEDRHGHGTVAMPAQATFYRLVATLATPDQHPNRPVRSPSPPGPFTPTIALRPGEQVQIDTTKLDIFALHPDGTTSRPELTIGVDIATRSILAAVLRPGGTRAVDAALLLAEMAVPHPMRPGWPPALRLDQSPLPLHGLLDLDERLREAAARPVVVPETIVVDRGKVYLSVAFTAACESLGISVQPTPPRTPTAKGVVERTFGTINDLFCQHVAGHTGSGPTRRGPHAQREACWSIAELQDLLDQWLVHYHHRPHEGLRHPTVPNRPLTPNQMWAALVATCGHVPVPLTAADYLELLPVRWHTIGAYGIRIDHRTYDHPTLNPHRRQPSPNPARGSKWEIHHNPHDARQIWIRLPDDHLTEIPWIHRDHVHRPFNDRTWHHIKNTLTHPNPDRHQHEADLADALDQLQRRTRNGNATRTEHTLNNRTAPARTPPPADHDRPEHQDEREQQHEQVQGKSEQNGRAKQKRPGRGSGPSTGQSDAGAPAGPAQAPGDLEAEDRQERHPDRSDEDDDRPEPQVRYTGLGLYDAEKEAELW